MASARLSLGFVLALVVAAGCGGSAFSPGSSDSDAGVDGPSGSSSGSGSSSSSGAGSGSSSGGSQSDGGNDGPIGSACLGAFHCVPGVPLGWVGPVELYDGTVMPPPCDSGFSSSPAYDGNDMLLADPATCGCTCDVPAGVLCAAPRLEIYSSATCASTSFCTSYTPTAGQCTPVDFGANCSVAPAAADFSLAQGTATGGTCTPVPSKSLNAPSWSIAGRACTPASPPVQADCPAQALCVPKTSSPYLQGLCIMRAGDAVCPTLGYSAKHVLYSGFDDARGCTACTCGSATGTSCSTALELFTTGTGTCGGAVTPFTAPIMCSPPVAAGVHDVTLVVTPTGGTCAPGGAQPTGTVTPSGPTTFCCVP